MNKNASTGISFGLITGLVYCILLFIRWQNATNFMVFGLLAFLNYLLIIGIIFYEAYYRRKQEPEGYIDFKNLLQTLFISVLVFEFFYSIFNLVYLTYVDPDVVNKMKVAMQQMLDKAGSGISDEQRESYMSNLNNLKNSTDIGQLLQGYLISIAVSGVIAMIIASIMKKNKPIFKESN